GAPCTALGRRRRPFPSFMRRAGPLTITDRLNVDRKSLTRADGSRNRDTAAVDPGPPDKALSMDNYITASRAAGRAGGCRVVGIYEDGRPGEAAAEVDAASDGLIRRLVRAGDLSGELGDARLLPQVPGVRAQRIVVAGLGKRDGCGVAAL